MPAPFNLRQQAYERVRDLVRTGRLTPGARVSTLELSRRLGISRTPIREALSKLASEGIVREVPGFGAYVHEPDSTEVSELYGLREVLEAYAAREAAAHITDAELDRLDELRLRMRAIAHHLRDGGERFLDARSRDLWIDVDEKFHETLLKAAGNRLLTKTVDDMRVISRTLEARRHEPEGAITLSMLARTYLDHARLLRALRRRDGDAAERSMRQQLRVGREQHLRMLRERESAANAQASADGAIDDADTNDVSTTL